MIDILKQGLVITGIGMGLVFVMIFVLWGIMALLVWITNPKEKKVKKVEVLEEIDQDPAELDVPSIVLVEEEEYQRLAASIAVAYALKRPRPQSFSPAAQVEQSSGWLSVGRTQQLLSRNRGRNS
jgi:Na+-transporting methylmalonyl-CoA/oxaloacetate decarboxylase gamma subunit